jgi:hypothetical protein
MAGLNSNYARFSRLSDALVCPFDQRPKHTSESRCASCQRFSTYKYVQIEESIGTREGSIDLRGSYSGKMAVVSQDELLTFFTLRCPSHSSGVPAASANSVTSGGNVSSRIAATMSGASVVRLTMRLT